jgi:diaminopimelate decarboxylase
VGGGFGVRYHEEQLLDLRDLGAAVARALRGRPLTLVLEPGRFLVAEAGQLVTRVLYRKEGRDRRFLVVDAGMTELIRPSLYGAWHRIEPLEHRPGPEEAFDVVGPICESADFLMSSSYNGRRRVAEVLVEGDAARLVRRRDSFEDLWRGEVES